MSPGSDEPWWWSVREAAHAIAERRISAVEYLEALLSRVERYDGEFNLVVTVDERARDAAEAADAGECSGPLHGVAVTVKDSFATRGLRSTGGSAAMATHVPRADAAVVAALRAAGALIYGKTNTPDGAADVQTYNDVFGVSRNPWATAYTTSGSSGGAAGALAAGFTSAEVGSDVAGSLRLPASACGVCAHKPSFGVVPTEGHLSAAGPLAGTGEMAVAGPLARTVADLEFLFDLLREHAVWQVTLPPAREVRRVAVWPDDPYCPVDREVRAAVLRTADLLSDNGIRVDDTRPLGIDMAESDRVFEQLLAGAAMHAYTRDDVERITVGDQPPGAELGGRFVAQTLHDWLAARLLRAHLRERWRLFFTRYDAILLPVAPNLTIEHDHRPFADRRITVNGVERPYWDQITWAGLTGVCELPSTVVPVGLDSRGLPLGVAIAGAYLDDRTTLALAATVERIAGPPARPPLRDTAVPA